MPLISVALQFIKIFALKVVLRGKLSLNMISFELSFSLYLTDMVNFFAGYLALHKICHIFLANKINLVRFPLTHIIF